MSEAGSENVKSDDAIPQARVRSAEQVATGRLRTKLWWLTGICTLLALGLVLSSFRSQGTLLTVSFEDGHGLKAGDTLRYRGIDVGEIISVKIDDDLAGVEVGITLAPENDKLAVEGSQFWIERPRFKLGQVSGLDTVLGAKYVGVVPGDPSASRETDFVGIESPLSITQGDSTEIRIQFPTGEGLAVGDTVQFRGITVGEVTYVDLSDDVHSVWVGVRLVGTARSLARQGTQFWIERPRLDLTEIRGLETLVGGRYIAIQPTAQESPTQNEFVGLANPPPLPRRDGSLEIELDAPSRLGLVRGAPITYRGLEVGRVANVGLSNDGATVKVNCVIDAEYAELVRNNSKWWAVGGIKVDANLRGVHVAVDSLAAWIRGGIAFATPENPGGRVVTGHRFTLEAEPQEDWLEWQPRIAVGKSQVYGLQFPEPVRVVASWKSSLLGLYRRRTVSSWAVAVQDNAVYLPASFLEETQEADGEVQIEVAGESFPFAASSFKNMGALCKLPVPKRISLPKWPASKVSSWDKESIVLIVCPELSEPMALDQTRLAFEKGIGLRIAPGVPISPSLSGSPVLNAQGGELIGIMSQAEDGWNIASLPSTP